MRRRDAAAILLLASLAQCFAMSTNPFDDGLLHGIEWGPPDVDDGTTGESVYVRTKENERYLCRIPSKAEKASSDETESRAGEVKPADVLAPLTATGQCMYDVQSYWTYEYCPGREIRQYHEEQQNRKRKRTAEYVLGREVPQPESDSSQTEEAGKVPKRRLGEKDYPYYSTWMKDGTPCDVTGTARQTEVLYVCEEQAATPQMLSIKETRSCEYEVIVATALLCAIPKYRAPRTEVQQIRCSAADGSPVKPKAQAEFEKELAVGQSTPTKMVRVLFGNKEAVVIEVNRKDIKTTQQGQTAVPDESSENPTVQFLGGENDEDSTEAAESTQPSKDSHRDVPLSKDMSLVRQFLRGEFCLNGGQGWWLYEFCYGRHVLQYHMDEMTREKTVVLLGTWDLDDHKRWFAQASTKKKFPKKGVVHHYSSGDVCDVTGKPRSVSVRLRCAAFDNPHQVSMYLEEPSTCVYVLTVESRIVCDLLGSVDSNGLLYLK